jgi:hypothetical protein
MQILFFTLLWAASAVAEVHAAQNVQAGQALAIDACSACHQVIPDQEPPASVFNPDENLNVLAPSFLVIADKYAHRPSALRRIITSPVHPMREQNWDPTDLATVIDFIQSLQPPMPTPRPEPVTP